MAATTKLIVWNEALREIGAARLADTTTVNTKQAELDAAWSHAVETVLAMEDWSFARRRAAPSTSADAVSFPPYTYKFTKPADFLRKCWVKASAADAFQIDHYESAAVIFTTSTTVLMEYVSDHADNYDPANWPPHFTRVMILYLAGLVAPRLARAGADDLGRLAGQMETALEAARTQEAAFVMNVPVPANRVPVMRRAMELLGQHISGSMGAHNNADFLRYQMMLAWDHTLKLMLERGAWNFAARRVILEDGEDPVNAVSGGIIEGYSLGPADDAEAAAADLPDAIGFDYVHNLPSGYLHKIWIKADAAHEYECKHRIMGNLIYTDEDTIVMEYVAIDSDAINPANWPGTFTEAFAALLAVTVSPELLLEMGKKGVKVMANDVRGKLEGVYELRLAEAKMRDAMQQEPKQIPPGRFVRARHGSGGIYGMRWRS